MTAGLRTDQDTEDADRWGVGLALGASEMVGDGDHDERVERQLERALARLQQVADLVQCDVTLIHTQEHPVKEKEKGTRGRMKKAWRAQYTHVNYP